MLVIVLLIVLIMMLLWWCLRRTMAHEHMCGGHDQGCHCAGNET
jgi:hypothetical protein